MNRDFRSMKEGRPTTNEDVTNVYEFRERGGKRIPAWQSQTRAQESSGTPKKSWWLYITQPVRARLRGKKMTNLSQRSLKPDSLREHYRCFLSLTWHVSSRMISHAWSSLGRAHRKLSLNGMKRDSARLEWTTDHVATRVSCIYHHTQIMTRPLSPPAMTPIPQNSHNHPIFIASLRTTMFPLITINYLEQALAQEVLNKYV